jgi:hypothetical protein
MFLSVDLGEQAGVFQKYLLLPCRTQSDAIPISTNQIALTHARCGVMAAFDSLDQVADNIDELLARYVPVLVR